MQEGHWKNWIHNWNLFELITTIVEETICIGIHSARNSVTVETCLFLYMSYFLDMWIFTYKNPILCTLAHFTLRKNLVRDVFREAMPFSHCPMKNRLTKDNLVLMFVKKMLMIIKNKYLRSAQWRCKSSVLYIMPNSKAWHNIFLYKGFKKIVEFRSDRNSKRAFQED